MGSSVTGTSVKKKKSPFPQIFPLSGFCVLTGMWHFQAGSGEDKGSKDKDVCKLTTPVFLFKCGKKIIPWVGWGTWDLMSHRTLIRKERSFGKSLKTQVQPQCATQLVLSAGNSLPCTMHNLHPEVYSSTSQKSSDLRGPNSCPSVFASLSTLQLDFRRVLN